MPPGLDPISTEEIQHHCDQPDRLTLLAMGYPARPFVRVFITTLEYTHYNPFTKAINDRLQLFSMNWHSMRWWVTTIPLSDQPKAEAVAKTLGLILTHSVPMLIQELEVDRFPIHGPRVLVVDTNWAETPWKPWQHEEMLEAENVMLLEITAKQEDKIRQRIAAGEVPGPEWK